METSNIKTIITKIPSYLYKLLNITCDVILIHKANDPLNESYIVPTPVKRKDIDEDNYLDITGSPLKVDLNNSSFFSIDSVNNCSNFWQKSEETHFPLSYYTAQEYIQDYISQNYKNEINLSTWWILDGADEDRTVLMSVKQMPTYITRSVVKLQGYIQKTDPSINFETLCNKHFDIISDLGETHKVPLRQLTSNVSRIYELCGTKITAMDFDDKSDIPGSVYLEISWDQCCPEIPLDHSKSCMTIQTIVGQDSSLLSEFWNELILLELYIKTLNEYSSETMLNNHWLPSYGDTSKNQNLVDQVIKIVYNCQDAPRHNIHKDEANELAKIVENVNKRHTCDITDKLWGVLNKCSTYGSLNDCLNIVFTEIINNDNSVYISDSNMTNMAQIIRDIAAGKTSVFMLTGTQPIEILIDIGIEKLRKDFCYIFSQFGIATEQDLRELFDICTKQNSGFDLNKDKSKFIRSALYHKKSLLNLNFVDKRMKTLGQIHTVLETLILVPSFWQLLSSKTIYEHYVGKDSPIDSFSALAKCKLYEIDVDLPVTKVYEYIKTITPIMWRLSLILSKPLFSVKNVFHFSQHPIFPPIIYKLDVMHETIVDSNVAYYHYTLLTEVTNFIKTNLV